MKYTLTPADTFRRATANAWDVTLSNGQTLGDQLDPNALMTSHYDGARCYLSEDSRSGYVIRPTTLRHHFGDLQTVWSTRKGRGSELVASAIHNGAVTLDCFDGYLTEFYGSHGFVETNREANWVQPGPDVVYMTLEA